MPIPYRKRGTPYSVPLLRQKSYDTVPKSKEILLQLDELQENKNTLMQEYSCSNDLFYELVQYKKNYENYMDKEVER